MENGNSLFSCMPECGRLLLHCNQRKGVMHMDVKTAGKLLGKTSREELIRIISHLSACSEEAEKWLLNYCNDRSHEKDRDFAAEKQLQSCWNIAEEIINENNRYGEVSDQKEAMAYDAMDEINRLAESYDIPWEIRREIVDRMMAQFYLSSSGFEDVLAESCDKLCQSEAEQLYYANCLAKSASHYYRQNAADIYQEFGRDDLYLDLQTHNLEYASDYVNLADYYKSHGDEEKALALAEQALTAIEGKKAELYDWLFREYREMHQNEKILHLYQTAMSLGRDLDTVTKQMYEYYADNYDRKKEFLLKMPEVCRSSEVKKWFDECRNKLAPEDYNEHKERLYTILKNRNPEEYLQLRLNEGNYEEVLEFLKHKPTDFYGLRVDSNHRFSRQLAPIYPKEICAMYWEECELLCAFSNQKNYMAAVRILHEIKALCHDHGMEQDWENDYAAFLERHSRKRILMDVLAKEKDLALKQQS